jgi:hypothetical protein
MANNYLFLVYRPTGRAIQIGKRMGFGWYTHNDEDVNLKQFYSECEQAAIDLDADQDDFVLVKESDNGWHYGKDENGRLIIVFENRL